MEEIASEKLGGWRLGEVNGVKSNGIYCAGRPKGFTFLDLTEVDGCYTLQRSNIILALLDSTKKIKIKTNLLTIGGWVSWSGF